MRDTVLDLSELQRYFTDIHQGRPLDDMDSEAYVRIIGKVREIFETPGLMDLIQVYLTTMRDADKDA